MCYAEYGEHTAEVTQVRFCPSGNRAMSSSLDKQIKVYCLASKLCIKTISAQSPISTFVIDHTESNIFVACDNQNIYIYGLDVQPLQQDGQVAKSK